MLDKASTSRLKNSRLDQSSGREGEGEGGREGMSVIRSFQHLSSAMVKLVPTHFSM